MKKKHWIIVLLLLLLMSTAAWAWLRTDPQMAAIDALRAQMQVEDLSRDQRRDLFKQMREAIDGLSPAAKEAFFAEREKERYDRDKKRMQEFFALSKEKQLAELDKQIDRFRRGRRGGPGGGPGGGPQRPAGAQGATGATGQQGGPGQGGGGGGFGGGRGGGRGNLDSMDRRKNFLDRTTPDYRAQMGEYRRMLQARRTQRGV